MRITSVGLLSLTACAGFHIAGFGTPPAPTLNAMNPLGGRALTSQVTPSDSDLQVMRGENCTTWPINDGYEIEADPQQVCVTALRHILSYESGPGIVEQMQVTVSTDGRPSIPMSLGISEGPRKIGRCYQGMAADNHRTGLWEVVYSGCRHNDFITASTAKVTLNKRGGFGNESELVKWALIDAAPKPQAVAAAPAPAPAAAPAQDADTCYRNALPLLSSQRYADALDAFSRCVQLNPKLAEGYAARGNALMGLHRFSEAVADYEYALKLRPDLIGTMYALGEANAGAGRPQAAKVCYQRFAATPGADAGLKKSALAKAAAIR